jgi:hypothetical protein
MTDHLPVPHPPPDQMEVIQTHWGPMERWRAVAMCIGEISNVVTRAEKTRNDSVEKTPLHDSQKPPPLVADADQQQGAPAVDPDLLAAIEQKVDELNARIDAYERMKRAHDALCALEDRIEAGLPVDDEDLRDDGDLLIKHMGDDDRTLN